MTFETRFLNYQNSSVNSLELFDPFKKVCTLFSENVSKFTKTSMSRPDPYTFYSFFYITTLPNHAK